MKARILSVFFLLFITVSCDQLSSNNEDTIVWDMPTPFADTIFHTQNIYQFVKDVEQLTEGVLKIRVHSHASLYKHPEIKQAVRAGQVPIGEIVISLLGNENSLFEVDSLPLLATSYEEAQKLWDVSQADISKLLESQGLKLLYAVPWPPQGLYIKKPVTSLDDFQGLKIRVYNVTLTRLVELMHGTPTTVQSPEIPQAFSTGVIDAMITSPSTGVGSQCWDYVGYYYDIKTWIPKNMVIVNQKAFNALPKNFQQALIKAAGKAEQRGWAMSQQETEEKLDVLRQHGMKVLKPTDEFKTSLDKIRRTMIEEWRAKSGQEGEKILKSFFEQ